MLDVLHMETQLKKMHFNHLSLDQSFQQVHILIKYPKSNSSYGRFNMVSESTKLKTSHSNSFTSQVIKLNPLFIFLSQRSHGWNEELGTWRCLAILIRFSVYSGRGTWGPRPDEWGPIESFPPKYTITRDGWTAASYNKHNSFTLSQFGS